MQTKQNSLLEVCLNVASGYIIAMIVWRLVVAPGLGLNVDYVQNIQVTTIFTGISVIRGYIWRRVFNG